MATERITITLSKYRAMTKALEQCERLFKEALPKFNWRDSALDANAIRLLNEVPGLVAKALKENG